jgi:diguanylate cyclase (GGDEF)-like protein
MQFYPAAWLKLVLPAVLIIGAFLGRSTLDTFGDDVRVLFAYLPYLLCAVSVLLAYQFNRCRLALAAVAVMIFYWLVQSSLQSSLEEAETVKVYMATSLSLPAVWFYLLVLPEKGILNRFGPMVAGGFILVGLIAYLLGPWLSQVNASAMQYYSLWPWEGYVMSRGVTLLVLLVTLVGTGALALRHEESEASLLGAFFSLYLMLAKLHLDNVSAAMGTAAALCVLWGVMRSSHAMAYRDDLTDLPGRRALNERLKMLGRNFTIAMLDVDHFKRFNDTHGHDVGDDVLRLVASRVRAVRGGGTAYRYGGEEFCVVFPRRSLEECVEPMDEVRDNIANYKMSIRDNKMRPKRTREGSKRRGATRLGKDEVRVTVSVGLAERGEGNLDPSSVVKAADEKLYQAKRAGRNRVRS